MSISSYLLFFSLSLSLLNACNARHIGSIDSKKLHISNIKDDEKGIDKVPVLPETNNKETSVADEAQKLKDKEANHQEMSNNDETEKMSGNAVKTDALVSVSWRLPRSEQGEKHPNFNSDYSPPKTHPPSHN